MRYFPSDAKSKIHSYKYVGSDNSFLYRFLLSPLADWLVKNVIPGWVSPNLLTTISFLCVLMPNVWFLAGG
jgi:ethanolaminephosphotransferase